MRKLLAMSAISLACLTGCEYVPAGHKGVIVNLYGETKGVSDETVGVGRYFTWPNKQLFIFPTYIQNYTWKGGDRIQMQTKEGLVIYADVGISYDILPENVSKVFQKYRAGVDEITRVYLHNMVRDAMNEAASELSVEALVGSQKEYFITKVNELVKKDAAESGIDVLKIYLVGSLDLPQTVIESINSKIQATQNAMRVENEVASARAEAQKTIISAKAQADANKMIAESISRELVMYQAIQKWDGKVPRFMGSDMNMLMGVSKDAE